MAGWFWPLSVGHIDIDALRRDRDQVWGEAATLEAEGVSLVLDPALWPAAAEEQEKRRLRDPWEDRIENMPPSVKVREGYSMKDVQIIYHSDGKELVRSADVLEHVLGVQTGHQNSEHGRRLARVMPRCGWQAGRFSIAGRQERGYCRVEPSVDVPEACRLWFNEQQPDGSKRRDGECWTQCREGCLLTSFFKLKGRVGSIGATGPGWFVMLGRALLGQAGRIRRFSTFAEAQAALDGMVADSDGWEWVACEPVGRTP
jgi:hypothetical protein